MGVPRAVRGSRGRAEANGESRWVLKVDVNDGAPFGGSGGQYFVGHFDGKDFRSDGIEVRSAVDRLRQGLLRLADLERCPGRAARSGSPG